MSTDNGIVTNPKHKYKPSTIIKVGQDKPAADKKRHYVDKELFYAELVKRAEQWKVYYQLLETNDPIKPPRVSELVGQYIIKICEGLAKKYNFTKIEYKDLMISAAIEQCIRYIDSFDINKTNNPFSYFTQTAYYAFLDYIKLEEEIKAVKYREMLDSMSLQEYIEHDGSENVEHAHDNFEVPDIDHMRNFLGKYQENRDKKIKTQKEKAKVSKATALDDIWAGE